MGVPKNKVHTRDNAVDMEAGGTENQSEVTSVQKIAMRFILRSRNMYICKYSLQEHFRKFCSPC